MLYLNSFPNIANYPATRNRQSFYRKGVLLVAFAKRFGGIGSIDMHATTALRVASKL